MSKFAAALSMFCFHAVFAFSKIRVDFCIFCRLSFKQNTERSRSRQSCWACDSSASRRKPASATEHPCKKAGSSSSTKSFISCFLYSAACSSNFTAIWSNSSALASSAMMPSFIFSSSGHCSTNLSLSSSNSLRDIADTFSAMSTGSSCSQSAEVDLASESWLTCFTANFNTLCENTVFLRDSFNRSTSCCRRSTSSSRSSASFLFASKVLESSSSFVSIDRSSSRSSLTLF
mmetsp:Transcript_3173/g.5113  ORF Transcript_3173/g.5113 Transcript_3173/m.5113 type:complete len:232 (-) Transcript_3173:709-1404(-)